jgi:hypothetical protein
VISFIHLEEQTKDILKTDIGFEIQPSGNLVPRAFPFLSLGRREKALAPGGLLCILIGQ